MSRRPLAKNSGRSIRRAKRKGVGGKEFLPALAFAASFFTAAIFRISLCEMRRQIKYQRIVRFRHFYCLIILIALPFIKASAIFLYAEYNIR